MVLKASPPGPLSNREGERLPLAFPDKNAKGEVTPSPLELPITHKFIDIFVMCYRTTYFLYRHIVFLAINGFRSDF